MTRKHLIIKWLDGSLSKEEQEAFNALPDAQELKRIGNAAKHFKAPSYNSQKSYITLKTALDKETKHTFNWRPMLGIAAILIVALGVYLGLLREPIMYYDTGIAQQQTLRLPSNSEVILNAESRISFNETLWDSERRIQLEGEAFFNVTKGQVFIVESALGDVKVLGTQFDVEQRNGVFQVNCYEGLVQVDTNNSTYKLSAGHTLQNVGGVITQGTTNDVIANWTKGVSSFSSLPYKYVIEELERQYGVRVTINTLDLNQKFTGAFSHDNLELALKTIAQPLNLNFKISGKTVTLYEGR